MLAYADQAALIETLNCGYATFLKTSTKKLWTKGKESGNKLEIKKILVDCDQDALIYLVNRVKGGACHVKKLDGSFRLSCFYRELIDKNSLNYIIKEDKK